MTSYTTADVATFVADFVADFDKKLGSLAGKLRDDRLPHEDCRTEVESFIEKFVGGRDHPRWANKPLGGDYSFFCDKSFYKDSNAVWLFPNGLSKEAMDFWMIVVQSLPRFLVFRGRPRQQSKMREQLLNAADDYLDACGLLEDKAAQDEQPAKPSGGKSQPATADHEREPTYIGGGKLRIAGETLAFEGQEELVLQALIEAGAATKTELENKSGVSDAVAILKRIIRKHPQLKDYITLPGGRGKGGYRTTIKLVSAPVSAHYGA